MKAFYVTVLLCFLVVPVWGGVIVQYTFPGSTFGPTTVATGLSANDINATGSAGGLEPGITITDSMFLRVLVPSSTASAAVTNNQYFQFTITPDPGMAMTLTGFTFDATRGSTATPRGYVLRSSVDGFASDISSAEVTTAEPTFSNYSAGALGSAFVNLDSALTFRIYGYTPGTQQGLFFDNLTVTGDVTGSAVPEPAGFTLILLAGAIPAWRMIRKNISA